MPRKVQKTLRKALKKRAEDAEKRAEDAEKRAKDAEKRAKDAEKRAEDAEKRAKDAEKRAKDAEKRAEVAENRAEEMRKQVAAVTNSHGAIWQYFNDGSWETFPSEGNAEMHQAYRAYLKYASRWATITSGGVRRTVDFFLMQQEHVKTGNVRQVRLSLGVPNEWVTEPGDLLLQGPRVRSFYVMVEDPELDLTVQQILRFTGHVQDGAVPGRGYMQKARVKSIHRIENLHLWQRYKTKLTAMHQDHAKYHVQVAPVPLDVDSSRNWKILSSCQDSFACRDPWPVKCITTAAAATTTTATATAVLLLLRLELLQLLLLLLLLLLQQQQQQQQQQLLLLLLNEMYIYRRPGRMPTLKNTPYAVSCLFWRAVFWHLDAFLEIFGH